MSRQTLATLLPLRSATSIQAIVRQRSTAADPATSRIVSTIIADIERSGWPAALRHARRLGDLPRGSRPLFEPPQLKRALDSLDRPTRRVLESAARDIRSFATSQRLALRDITIPRAGFTLGHTFIPVSSAGCYVPGGRFPLPSSALMTAIPAQVARVPHRIIASPRPTSITLAAAALAGVDQFLAIGGAQAIAVLALGAGPIAPTDMIVGPGNRFVTEAKRQLLGHVGIDMLAGPSEVLIIADSSANPALIAADLLAQCEHDPDARGILITLDRALLPQVRQHLNQQLSSLPTAHIARSALTNSFAIVASSPLQAAALSNSIAPEHLEIHTRHPQTVLKQCTAYGAAFVGLGAAEVLGDYGIGPNHTLPTARTARFSSGLSVATFLTLRTFVQSHPSRTPAAPLLRRTVAFARLEGLEAHARAAQIRLPSPNSRS
jgi:histidinol dehydrogenase